VRARLAVPALALAAAAAFPFAPAASAQQPSGSAAAAGKPRRNDPALCPYCHGSPDLMRAAGIVSHGGFEFATRIESRGEQGDTRTAHVDAFLATADIRWIESAHFEIGLALAPYKVDQDERKKIEAELSRLRLVLPEVPKSTKVVDPWLRTHLYAQRCEDLWARMLALLAVKESDFPDGSKPWDLTGKYMGEGPYLGQKGKFEILIVPSKAMLTDFLREYYGLTIERSQRWNVVERDSLTLTARTDEGHLRNDAALHGHIGFNLAHNFLDGYKHYSYETPLWLHEGLAHAFERDIDPRYNSFDGSEGGVPEGSNREDWHKPVRALAAKGEAPSLSTLINLKSYAEFEVDHHYVCWSKVNFLIRQYPSQFACVLDLLKGRTNAQGFADGSNIRDVHREAFQSCLSMSYLEFDRAWEAWVLGRPVEK
jgi:hypothetical protein